LRPDRSSRLKEHRTHRVGGNRTKSGKTLMRAARRGYEALAQSLGHDEIGHVIISIWLDLVEPERTDHADPKDILAAMACKERRILDVAVMRHNVVDGHLAHLRRAVGQRL
jgi:hypothetical protein